MQMRDEAVEIEGASPRCRVNNFGKFYYDFP